MAPHEKQLPLPGEVFGVEGQGHNWWPGWFQCQELVDFVIAHAR